MNLINGLFNKFQESGLEIDWFYYAFILLVTIGPILGIASFALSILRLKNDTKVIDFNEKTLKESQDKLSISEIDKMLTTFYFPLRYYLIQSKMLYDTFALKEKSEASNPRFSALRFLCDGGEFSRSDQEIFDQILAIGEKQNSLIERKNWAIQDNTLSELLSLYSAHLRTLKLANNRLLIGRTSSLDAYKFPISLPGAIESKIFELTDKRESISSPNKTSKKKSNTEKNTLSFYNKNATEYYNRTIDADMKSEHSRFIDLIKPGALICDIGSGSGRDTKYFIENGFRVLSIEPSQELAKLASNYEFSYVQNKSLLDIDYRNRFDAIWCSAVLQHIEKKNLAESITRISRMLRLNGIIYLSYRSTRSSLEKNVTLHSNDDILTLFSSNSLKVLEHDIKTSTKDGKHQFNVFLLKKCIEQ